MFYILESELQKKIEGNIENIQQQKIYKYEYIISIKNNHNCIKKNLLPEETDLHLSKFLIRSDIDLAVLEMSENLKVELLSKQPKNSFKFEVIELLNLLIVGNFDKIFESISRMILSNKENDNLFNCNLNIFLDIIINKGSNEILFSNTYAKLCSELHIRLMNEFTDKKNPKYNKERNIKYLVNEKCKILFGEYINLTKKDLIIQKYKFFGFINFLVQLIIVEIIKQQFGFHCFDKLYQKFLENEIEVKYIYLDACTNLLNSIGKNIIEKSNSKFINNYKIYINENMANLINDNKILPNYSKYNLINLLEKYENEWSVPFYYKKNCLTVRSSGSNISKSKGVIEKLSVYDNDANINLIKTDILNYKSYSVEFKDKSFVYNWGIIDNLVSVKRINIGTIIIYYINVCKQTINDENDITISNNYIKNIIEYYAKITTKKDIEIIHNEMIKVFKNIDEIIDENNFMHKIMGNLLFILVQNRFYIIKDFNDFIKEDKQTLINLAKVTKYCIISSGKFSKKFYNDFKQTKLFINNNQIFNEYVTEILKDLFYYMK